LSLDNDGIVSLIEGYEKDTRAIKEEALKMTWFMRGGLSYDEAMLLSSHDKDIIAKIIKKNMETTKESGMPFF